MDSSAERRLSRLMAAGAADALRGGRIGLEKETLRVSRSGGIAQTPHPEALGAALTHPYITTDYSEALLELITPPMTEAAGLLEFLREAHGFVHEHLEDERLWPASMPCRLEGEASIPIARYGRSNAGRMKHLYRVGLGYRYGRTMQVIAGVHFNYSVPEGFWPLLQDLEGHRGPPTAFVSDRYMGMIRNLQRFGWLVPYLFGASPAVHQSFLGERVTDLQELTPDTRHYPFATSLRMGDIGYQNSLEEGRGFRPNYDSLETYVRSLTWAMETPCPDYERIGVRVNGEYRQLNAHVLQIENEHYSTIRPKQPPQDMEKPSLALRRRGVHYVELRSVDVNPFHPLGISEEQLYFLETLLVYSLLSDSPRIAAREARIINVNQILAAHRGREPGLDLIREGTPRPLQTWTQELLEAMEPVAEVLDGGGPMGGPRARVLAAQREVAAHPDQTPSARMLERMRADREGFLEFAGRMAEAHRDYFVQHPPSPARREFFRREAAASRARQAALEQGDGRTFEQFLADYFAQR